MFPIALDITKMTILLIGEGAAFDKRRAQLESIGAAHLIAKSTFQKTDLNHAHVLMVAGLELEDARVISAAARERKILVNVEDVPELCDFTFMAEIRRGDLLFAISTAGASPTLAGKIRDKLGQMFGSEWNDRTQEIRIFRDDLRKQGKSMREVMEATDALLQEKGWL